MPAAEEGEMSTEDLRKECDRILSMIEKRFESLEDYFGLKWDTKRHSKVSTDT